MFMKHSQITPVRLSAVLEAAEQAARAIPPAFPLDATVAVNPFLGQTGEDLAAAAARLARVAGVRITRTGADYAAAIRDGRISEDDLAGALGAALSPLRPADTVMLRRAAERLGDAPAPRALPTVADLAAQVTGIDWPALIDKCIGLWAAGHFDRGQALWSPAPGASAFASWRAWALHDLTPEIAGLKGFCAHVACAPDTVLGTGIQTARKAVDDGLIGRPIAATPNQATDANGNPAPVSANGQETPEQKRAEQARSMADAARRSPRTGSATGAPASWRVCLTCA